MWNQDAFEERANPPRQARKAGTAGTTNGTVGWSSLNQVGTQNGKHPRPTSQNLQLLSSPSWRELQYHTHRMPFAEPGWSVMANSGACIHCVGNYLLLIGKLPAQFAKARKIPSTWTARRLTD